MIGAPLVDWSALGEVIVYSLVAGILVPAVYAVAIRAASGSREPHRSGVAAGALGLVAVLCTAFCVASIVLGIWLMTQK